MFSVSPFWFEILNKRAWWIE